jgi:poly-gamma-glutamate capsule biosynthesis protein CapA/YwtB (metallophosphatase superfamily)
MKKSVLLFVSLFFFCSFIQNSNSNPLFTPENEILSLIFVGDVMGHMPQVEAAYNPQNESYNYDICFKWIKPYLKKADFAIANLEVPIAGKPYSGYPAFSSPDALLDALKNTGFTLLLTGNNHVLDRGKPGLERTISQLSKRKFLFAGSYVDENQRDSLYPIILQSKGIKIAILNCTYGTNGNEVEEPSLVNFIDTVEIINDINEADKLGADFKIMTIHWGTEYELQANEYQKTMSQFFVNHGINLIIGSHPHVVQNAETLITKDNTPVPVFYSLGNFISNQRQANSDGGIMVKVEIAVKSKSILKTAYFPVWVYRGILNAEYQYHLIPTADYIRNPTRFKLNSADSISLLYFDSETHKRLSKVEFLK